MGLPIGETADPAHADARSKLISAATECIAEDGWGRLTMERIARRAGLGRLTVNEHFSSKQELAFAIVEAETMRFLEVVVGAFDAYPADLVRASYYACLGVLEYAESHSLVQAILRGDQGVNSDLLPLLTTRSGDVRASAVALMSSMYARYPQQLPAEHRDRLAEVVVRTSVALIVDPTESSEAGARLMEWLVDMVVHRPLDAGP